ncbi:MAG: AAA family ATPase, partial [Luteibaculum sp.]
TPPKTQSALLEAMQEKKVTYGGKSLQLPNPFFVLATQNPIEQEGTYPLPEAQLDRFMFNIWVDYPSLEEELEIVKRTTGFAQSNINAVLSEEDILQVQDLVRKIPVTDTVFNYAVQLTAKTRLNEGGSELAKKYLSWGAGPRASQYLILGAKAHALINGKFAPDIEDVKAVALPVLRHRIIPNYRAEADGYTIERIVQEML